jgi:alanine dehydrogenase
MPDQPKGIHIPKILLEEQFHTQVETLQIYKKSSHLTIGIPKESTFQENRVALVPSSVKTLVKRGMRVLVESEAGQKSNFTDHDFSEAGAEIVFSPEGAFRSDILIKTAPPMMEELEWLSPNQILISPIHIPVISHEYLQKLRQKRVTAMAMEYIRDDVGSFPIVRILSEIAGLSAMLAAGELLTTAKGGKSVLLGGISGVPPAKVVVLGAGVVAESAIRTAIGLGAEVRVFDNSIHKLTRLRSAVGRQIYTCVLDPNILEREIITADVVIGAIHSKIGRSPMVVEEDLVMKMKPGSIIVDVSIDQGGCFETSRVTTHEHPTFVKHGVIHYCVPNISSRVAQTASFAISSIITPMIMNADIKGGPEQILYHNTGLRHGVYTYKGCLTNEYMAERFQIKYTELNLLLASDI